MVFIIGQMAIFMTDNGRMVNNMEWVSIKQIMK